MITDEAGKWRRKTGAETHEGGTGDSRRVEEPAVQVSSTGPDTQGAEEERAGREADKQQVIVNGPVVLAGWVREWVFREGVAVKTGKRLAADQEQVAWVDARRGARLYWWLSDRTKTTKAETVTNSVKGMLWQYRDLGARARIRW